MKHILFTFLILYSICSIAQNEQLILTKKANDLWFQSLIKTEELSEKIDLINKRLIADVDVYIKWGFPDGITVQKIPKLDSIRKIRTEGFCKPLYIVKYESQQIAFRIENPLNDGLTNSVVKLLNTNDIYDLDVWIEDERQVLFGTSADCGIIFLKTKKPKVFSAFKELGLPHFYMDEIENY
ncbi:hypothetical protein A7A78_00120 [Aequorivita soesokkakensis]|uniref:DUF4252 domain-containing protein n=1 Tax=Aequorivita soesokkakensis TaxID=1385699 RepID=A0A1A9LHZ4_9FLAO|nr:hypothetical protein [Aequorivita soesokkakensis]OAD92361.1 hypothetical protein A7A78_00120 [Aequorivita soesokkakensis]